MLVIIRVPRKENRRTVNTISPKKAVRRPNATTKRLNEKFGLQSGGEPIKEKPLAIARHRVLKIYVLDITAEERPSVCALIIVE
jgi:hypothetical protein